MAKRVPYLTVPQIAGMIKMSHSVVWRAMKNGEIKPINEAVPGKRFYAKFAQTDIDAWITERFGKPKKAANLPLLEDVPAVSVPTGPGRLTSIDEKLDMINVKLDTLLKLWS